MELKKVEKFEWELSKHGKMRVPARFYINSEMAKELKKEEKTNWSTLRQLKNIATLPGIQFRAIGLADCHPGYGAPIGGVAAMDLSEGVITFGSIGFDINCLDGNTVILTDQEPIKIAEFKFREHKICTMENNSMRAVNPSAFMKLNPKNKILKISTECGNTIKATEDHPFQTKNGMNEIKNLTIGAEVAVLENSKISWEKIEKIKETKHPEPVYDFTIPKTHNFIANNFVVSNCGVRTLSTPLKKEDIEEKKAELAEELFQNIPAGLGSTGDLKLNESQIDEVLVKGAEYAVREGYGFSEDLEFMELNGKSNGAKPENVSFKAKQRQFKQVGTLGSGNHYLEVQVVDKIFEEESAKAFGLREGQVLISIHCGSRALGHQIGTDYLKELKKASEKYNIELADKELVSAPISSEEGQKYFSAVKAGMNCAFANRQVLAHLARESIQKVLGLEKKEIKTLYEVGHNTAKIEKHKLNGKTKKLLVHRKGSTRGFGPGRKEVPKKYRQVGQPILVGGTMGTASYILRGTKKGMNETFGSGVHGAGRKMSRTKATKKFRGENIVKNLEKQGVIVKAHSWKGAAEEAPGAYKDINQVVKIMDYSGINKRVAKLKPLITIKG